MSELMIRVIVAIGLIGILVLTLIFGGWVQVAVFTFAAVVGVFEMDRMFSKKGSRLFTPPLYAVAALQLALLNIKGAEKFVPVLYLCAFLAIMIERILNKNRQQEELIYTLSVLVYPLALLLCFGLIGYGRMDNSRVALLMVFAGPSMADNNAYLFGRKFGKHKLCPSISPNKTVEGYIAGLIGGPTGGLIVYLLQGALFGTSVHWAWLVGLGFIGGVVGQFGDLFASTFKRWAGIKDFGKIFSKHGGVMDRLDSAMVFVPIVAVCFGYFIK